MNRVDRLQSEPSQFRPDTHHTSVDAVLEDPKLSTDEKRAILSTWASDMYAMESSPGMRKIPGHAKPIPIGWLLKALRRLDNDEGPSGGGLSMRRPAAPLETDVRSQTAIHTRPPNVSGLDRRVGAVNWPATAIQAHRSNIRRYHRLLETELTQLERKFITRRIAEERAAIQKIAASLIRRGGQ
jgi:hypothetical protein